MHLGRTGEAFFLGEEVEDGSGEHGLYSSSLTKRIAHIVTGPPSTHLKRAHRHVPAKWVLCSTCRGR